MTTQITAGFNAQPGQTTAKSLVNVVCSFLSLRLFTQLFLFFVVGRFVPNFFTQCSFVPDTFSTRGFHCSISHVHGQLSRFRGMHHHFTNDHVQIDDQFQVMDFSDMVIQRRRSDER